MSFSPASSRSQPEWSAARNRARSGAQTTGEPAAWQRLIEGVSRAQRSLWICFACFVLGLAVLPIAEGVPIAVALLCLALGYVGVRLCWRDAEEQRIVLRLFVGAYLMRLAFTYVFYKAGLEPVLGGADADVWQGAFLRSRWWWAIHRGLSGVTSEGAVGFPDSLAELYTTAKRNSGYNFCITYFYYWLNVPSQLALAYVNSFASALTVIFVYQSARLFNSRAASVFAACWAVFLPGLVIWGALTLKEPWVICGQIAGFLAVWNALRAKSPFRLIGWMALAIFIAVALKSFRFYIAYTQCLGLLLTVLCYRSRRPLLTALVSVAGLFVLLILAIHFQMVHLDLAGMAQEQIETAENYRASMGSGPGQRSSSIIFDYDLNTPDGFLKMLGVGFMYLMFSPFLWQVTNARQAAALPDVLLWYVLVLGFVVPGMIAMARRRADTALSLVFYFVPLVIAYSISFANVGLAFRQRGQFIPFLLIFAAAGYDWRRSKGKADRAARRRDRTVDSVLGAIGALAMLEGGDMALADVELGQESQKA